MKTTLSETALAPVLQNLRKANAAFAARYPGESARRQPVHTVYGGAQVFKADTASRLGALALRALEEYAPDASVFAEAVGLPAGLAARIYPRVLEKLRREPVEDFRIDFEDGYGDRTDPEEDRHAVQAAREVAAGLSQGKLSPWIGIRIKPLRTAPRCTPRGGSITVTSGAPSSTATTRGGTFTRRNCRPDTPRSTPSSSRA